MSSKYLSYISTYLNMEQYVLIYLWKEWGGGVHLCPVNICHISQPILTWNSKCLSTYGRSGGVYNVHIYGRSGGVYIYVQSQLLINYQKIYKRSLSISCSCSNLFKVVLGAAFGITALIWTTETILPSLVQVNIQIKLKHFSQVELGTGFIKQEKIVDKSRLNRTNSLLPDPVHKRTG